MPQAITMDAAVTDFIIEGNDWTEAVAGLLDNSGNVTKSIGGNIPTSMLEVVSKFSGTLVQQPSGTSATYLADTGEVGNVTINDGPQLYPTSARTIRRLRVTSKSGTGGKAMVVTLYKNNTPTSMVVTIAPGASPGTTGVDSAHPVTFADGDTYDVVASMTSGTGDGPYFLSAVLEGPPPGP
jgi:hypothetical protein